MMESFLGWVAGISGDVFSLWLAQAGPVAPAAPANPGGGGGGGGQYQFIPLAIGCLAIVYFVMIRPERQKEKTRKEMLGGLKKNDRVVTIGGMHGVVVSSKEDEVVLKVDEAANVKLRFSRAAIHRVLSDKNEKGDKSVADEKTALETDAKA